MMRFALPAAAVEKNQFEDPASSGLSNRFAAPDGGVLFRCGGTSIITEGVWDNPI